MIKKDKLIHIYSDQNKIIADIETGQTYTDILTNESDTREFIETNMNNISEMEDKAKLAALMARQAEYEKRKAEGKI